MQHIQLKIERDVDKFKGRWTDTTAVTAVNNELGQLYSRPVDRHLSVEECLLDLLRELGYDVEIEEVLTRGME